MPVNGSEPKVTLDLAVSPRPHAPRSTTASSACSGGSRPTPSSVSSRRSGPSTAPTSTRGSSSGACPTKGPHVLQGPGENAGVVDIGEGLALVVQDREPQPPVVHRAVPGRGDRGRRHPPRHLHDGRAAHRDPRLAALRRSGRRAADAAASSSGVVSGIRWYGNCFGVPDGRAARWPSRPSTRGNPLVNVDLRRPRARRTRSSARAPRASGNPVFYVGAKTGRDGIHGATMASATFDETPRSGGRPSRSATRSPRSSCSRPASRRWPSGAVVGIQDMGAAGLACCSSEMPARAGTGIDVELDRVPQREAGMTPYEILLSESQERMLLVVARGREDEVQRVFAKWELDAVAIGRVTDDGLLRARMRGEVVAEVPVRALTDEAPVYDRPRARPPGSTGSARSISRALARAGGPGARRSSGSSPRRRSRRSAASAPVRPAGRASTRSSCRAPTRRSCGSRERGGRSR